MQGTQNEQKCISEWGIWRGGGGGCTLGIFSTHTTHLRVKIREYIFRMTIWLPSWLFSFYLGYLLCNTWHLFWISSCMYLYFIMTHELLLGDFIICMWAFLHCMGLVVEHSFGTLVQNSRDKYSRLLKYS